MMAKHKNRYVCTLKYNGTRKYFSAKTKHEAENMRDAFIDRYINPSSQEQLSRETLFTDWLDHYIEDARHNVREQTLESYNVLVEKHIKPGLGSYHLADLTTAVIKKFLYGKIDDGYSHRTVNYLRVIIGAALNLAVDEDILVKTPMHKIPPFAKQPKRRRIALDETSLQKFLSVVDDPQLHFMYLLDVSLGLRREELLGLTWKEINLDDCYLNVANTLIGFNGGTLTPLTKNSSSRRQIYFNEDIRQGFLATRKRQDGWKAKAKTWTVSDLVFTRPNGVFLKPDWFTRKANFYKKLAGIDKDFTVHCLRHTTASLMRRSGIDLKTISSLLGHSSIQITADTYEHMYNSEGKALAQVMPDILGLKKKQKIGA